MKKTLIERVDVGAGGAASITFSSIPGDFTDLYLVASLREATGTDAELNLTFNGSATGYSWRYLIGDGSAVASSGSASGTHIRAIVNPSNATASVFGNLSVTIPNYTSSNYKSASVDSVSENNGTTAYQRITAGLWSNTAAITSITLAPYTGNWAQFSSASLYGVTAGSDGTTTVS